MTPFTNSTLENFEGCEFRCDRGWLPTDGEVDAEIDDENGAIVFTLIIPTEFTACPCSPLWSMNSEMEGVQL